jgi:hypothetical protein
LDRRVNLFNSSQSLSHQCKKIKRPNVNPAIILEDMEVLPIVEEEEVGEVVVEEVGEVVVEEVGEVVIVVEEEEVFEEVEEEEEVRLTHSPVEGSQVESKQFLD